MLDQNGFNQLINIYKQQGMIERMAYKKIFTLLSESFSRLGNKEQAELYAAEAAKI
jgi:hypothetical protein